MGIKQGMSAKTLCEMTGTKFYVHNEGINLAPNRVVRVYDEHDQLVGDMTLEEA